MPSSQPSLLARDDTLLGICQALGEDFGFNPLYLRVALASGLLWNPAAMVGAYAVLGALVLVSRLIVRVPRAAPVRAEPAASVRAPAESPGVEAEPEPLAIAA